MSDTTIGGLLDKFASVWIIPIVFGAGLAGWAGLAVNDIEDQRWKAYVEWKKATESNQLLKDFVDKSLTELMQKQQQTENTNIAAALTYEYRDNLKEQLQKQIDHPDERRDFETEIGRPRHTYALILIGIFGLVVVGGAFYQLHKREEDDRKFARLQAREAARAGR